MTTSGHSRSIPLTAGLFESQRSLPWIICPALGRVGHGGSRLCRSQLDGRRGQSSPQSSRAGTGPLVTATVLGQGTAPEKLAITTAGASDVVVQQVTIQSGGRTGWHTHAGKVLAVVKAGTLTRYTADCKAVTYPAGQAFVETEGVHEGRNQGTVPVELYVTYIDPAGSPLKTNAIAPACGR
jgi:quercetin dioxygenase-like cupin family protein